MSASKLRAKTVPVSALNETQIDQMYRVFEKYYGSVKKGSFVADLENKNDIIILFDPASGHVKGFSTILNYRFELAGRPVRGIFSGDTIVEKEYWGGSALQFAFVSYLLKEKLKRPFSPLYWFLISKGYKTYLLMANNFKEHYPRFEKETPAEEKKIMDEFASRLYPEHYEPSSGLIRFEGIHDHLKCDVAPISRQMLLQTPRIRFFAKANPSWENGSELVCLARFDLAVPLNYTVKTIKKMSQRSLRSFYQQSTALMRRIGVR